MSVNADAPESVVALATEAPVWERFFTVAPLVLVGSKERDGYDLAPKHMAMPLGWGDYFCFVCSPRHATYRNVLEHRSFTVSFPRPEQIVEAGMAAGPRAGAEKPTLAALSTFPATRVDGVLVEGCRVFLECELDRIVDGFGDASLIVGRVVAALAAESSLRLYERDDNEIAHEDPLLVYVSPGRFARVSETFSFPFPAGFEV